MECVLARQLALLILPAVFLLSACGGGSGGGAPTENQDDDDQEPEPPAISGDYLCPSHTTTNNTVTGNNVYQFQANNGQCFGTLADHGLVKRTVPVVAQPRNNTPGSYATFSADAKLTTNATTLVAGGGEHMYLSLEVTNNHTSEICLEIYGATLADSDDTLINEIEAEVMGDLFYGERAGGFRFSTDCIASGATRFVWGQRLASYDKLEAGGLPALDHINIEYQITEPKTFDTSGLTPELIALLPPRPTAYYPDALDPMQAQWSSSSQSIQGIDYHDFKLAATYVNLTEQAVTIDFRSTDLIYMDDDDYIVYATSATLHAYLGVDDDDLEPSDYYIDAMGGTTGFTDEYANIRADFGDVTFIGRATRLYMALELCHGLDLGVSCDVRN